MTDALSLSKAHRMEKLLFLVFQEVEHLSFQWNTSQRPF